MADRNVNYSYYTDLTPIKEFIGVQIFMCQSDGKFVFQRPERKNSGYHGDHGWVAKPTMAAIEKEIAACVSAIKVMDYSSPQSIRTVMVSKPEGKSDYWQHQRWRLKDGTLTTEYSSKAFYVFDEALYKEAKDLATAYAEFEKTVYEYKQNAATAMEKITAKLTRLTAENFKEQSEKSNDIQVDFEEGDLLD